MRARDGRDVVLPSGLSVASYVAGVSREEEALGGGHKGTCSKGVA